MVATKKTLHGFFLWALKNKMLEITHSTKVSEVLETYKEAKEVFIKLGYKCVDCAVNKEDSLIVAAKYHNKDLDELLNYIKKLSINNSKNSLSTNIPKEN